MLVRSCHRWLRYLLAASLFPSGVASACPICLGLIPQQPTLADEIRAAEAVVIVQADSETGSFTVLAAIKGDEDLEGTRVALTEANPSGASILAREGADQPWKYLGPSGIQLAKFFPVFLGLPGGEPKDDAAWSARLALVRPFLGHLDGRVARSAWVEWARAPYGVIRSQRIEPAKLRAWLADPAQAYAHPMWIALLSHGGDGDDARRVNERLEAAWKTNEASLVAALLAARIETEGEKGVAWLEERYIRDRDRTLDEIQAALVALSVQGSTSTKLRPRIVAAYRTLLAERRPLSGFAAGDLTAWEDWSAASHFEGLLASGEPILPQTRPAISAYVEACRKHASAKPETTTHP